MAFGASCLQTNDCQVRSITEKSNNLRVVLVYHEIVQSSQIVIHNKIPVLVSGDYIRELG